MNVYTNPDSGGCLLEAEACKLIIKELDRIREKYQRKVDREKEARRKELAAVMEYANEGEILDAYGCEIITRQQYERCVDVFRQGESMLENHPPTKAERVCKILFRIRRDILAEQQEWAFSALSPEEQAQERARQNAALRKWKNYLKDAQKTFAS